MPRLQIKEGPGVGRDHALGAAECVIGRDASADFVLEDTLVSRRHLRVVQADGGWIAEDLDSTNGMQVNGRRTKRFRLSDGDTIRVGSSSLVFVQKDLLGGGGGAPVPVRKRRKLR
jgi:pSer/pThr/pTyr-binding forkhead associated (FHA) protein